MRATTRSHLLVATGMGEGTIIPVDSIATSGRGRLELTSSFDEVIKESAEIALSWVKTGSQISMCWTRCGYRMYDRCAFAPSCGRSKERWTECRCRLLTGKCIQCVPPTAAMAGEVRVPQPSLKSWCSDLTRSVQITSGLTCQWGQRERTGYTSCRRHKVIEPWANWKDVPKPKEVHARTARAGPGGTRC